RLRMLDTEADGEGLRLEMNATLLQHAQRIAGAVSEREHDVATSQSLAVLEQHAFQLACLDQQIGHLALEAHFTAQRNDFLAHLPHHARETKGADVRLADEENLGRRAGAHELVEYFPSVKLRVLDLAVELAIGEQTRTALAELNVGLRRQGVLPP